ncbi:beta strand repeat-containing protein [Bdellovibrio sp.]|uniref:beta strand repeat-containing protein n=1 Tax=Bdellovibrio sp. TaxID=28201 RepID=UPI0039E3E560
MSKMFTYMFALLMFSLPSFAMAQHKGINFQAMIKRPDGTFPTASGLTVTLQILDPVSNCVLREEEHSGKNVSNGYLNLVIGDASASTPLGKNPTPVLSISEVMDNKEQRTGLKCVDINNNVISSNQTYVPSNVDRRVLRVRLNIQGDDVVADFNMRAVAFAVNSEMLNSKTDTDFVNINDAKGVTKENIESIFERFTKLDSLLNNTNGTGTNLGINITGNAATATNVTGTVGIANGGTGASSVEDARTNLGLGPLATMAPTGTASTATYLRGDGAWVSVGGGVSSVAGKGGDVTLEAADISDLNGAVDTRITNQKGQNNGLATLNASGKVPSAQLSLTSADVPALDASKITSGTFSDSMISSLSIDKLTNAAMKYFNYKPNNTACADNEVLKYDSLLNLGAGGWKCASVVAGVSSVAGKTGAVSLDSTNITDFTTAVDTRITNQKGQNNGLATLNASGKVPSTQLSLTSTDVPSLDWSKVTTGKPTTLGGYGITDAVVNGGNTGKITSGLDGSKPGTPASGEIFVATDVKKIYRWSGSAWDVLSTGTATGTITSLTGDVTAGGTGPVAATVAQVGGVTAVNVASGANAANAATNANTVSTIVKRDASGNFSAGTVTATTFVGNLTGSASNNVLKSGDTMTGALTINAANEVRFADTDSSNYVGFKSAGTVSANKIWTLPAADGTANQVLKTDGAGNLGWATASTGSVTNVSSANTDISVATGASTPVLTLNSGTAGGAGDANKIAKLDASGLLSVNMIPAHDASKVTSGTLPVARGGTGLASGTSGGVPYYSSATTMASTAAPTTAGQALRFNGTQWAPGFIGMQDLRSTVTGSNFFASSCGPSQTLTYNSVGDVMSCASIAISNTQVSGLGSLATKSSVDLSSTEATGTLAPARMPALSGDVTSSVGTTALTLATTGTAGTYYKVTTDSKGRVTSGVTSLAASDVPSLDWSKITSGKPTSLSGYGIADAVANGGGVPSLKAGADASKGAAGTAGRLYISSDTKKVYYDTGAAWIIVGTTLGSDISGDISGKAANVTGTIAVANGGTGATTLALNNVVLGNGTSAVQVVAPGASGNVLTSNGTTWVSQAASSGGRTSCPAGFTLIGTSGSTEAFCISSSQETSATWANANIQCRSKSPKARLCTASEWAAACFDGAAGPNNMTGHWEWVADLGTSTNGQVMGDSGCDSFNNLYVTNPAGSRCCFR